MKRERILIRASWVSTIGNAVLSAAKIVAGLLAGSLAVVGDGIDSASDVAISIVMIFTAKVMKRPPNRKYAYGYKKAEGVATKILSMLIFYAGIQILVSSGKSLLSGEHREMPSMLAIYVTLFSIAGKLFLALYQSRQGRRIKSSMLTANAVNMRNDVLLSVGVLLGLGFTFILNMPVLDAVTGLIISFIIIRSAVDIFLESNVGLMDGVKDTSVYDKIFKAVESVPGTMNPHRVRTRQIGNMYMIDIDIEVDGSITLNEAHQIADAVETSIRSAVRDVYDIVVHVEPAGTEHRKERYGVDYRSYTDQNPDNEENDHCVR